MPNWGAFGSIIASWCQYFSPPLSRSALVSLTKLRYHFAPKKPQPPTETPVSVRIADAVQDEEKQSQVPVHFTFSASAGAAACWGHLACRNRRARVSPCAMRKGRMRNKRGAAAEKKWHLENGPLANPGFAQSGQRVAA